MKEPDNWGERGICAQTDPELFFPVRPNIRKGGAPAIARAMCEACTVLEQCQGDVAAGNIVWGIKAGMGPDEQLKLARSAA